MTNKSNNAQNWVPPVGEVRAPRPLDIIDPLTLRGKAPPERRWLVPGFIPLHQVTLMAGDGGLGNQCDVGQSSTSKGGES